MFSFDQPNLQAAIEQFGQRVKQKIRSIGYRRDLFCYLLVEELLLLLDVPAIYVRTSGVPRTPSATGPPSLVDADANISDADLAILVEIEKTDSLQLAAGVTKRSIKSKSRLKRVMIGSLQKLEWQVDLQVELKGVGPDGQRSLEVAFWGSREPFCRRRSSTSSTAIMKGTVSWYFLLGELQTILGNESRCRTPTADLKSEIFLGLDG